MAKLSKFVKLDKNVLLEYIYNDGNLVSEQYDILVNSKDRRQSYMATETSATGNTQINQLFKIDGVSNKYGKVNPDYYTFLQVKNFPTAAPIRHDVLKFHLPVNWTFGEYLGFYIRVYTFDSSGKNTYELSNFYFDMTDVSQQYLMNFTSPPLLFQEKLWGKNIQIEIPAVSEISTQLTDNRPTDNSINANLTNGIGLSLTSPIFIDFSFISGIQTINAVTTYLLQAPVTTTIPQTPEFEKLGLMIENSPNGDFFEIYGTYNNTIAEFKKFLDDSVSLGNRYYVQYNITMYEQNIRGKTSTITVTDNFNETIEYRPIIKYSTTTAIIDVEMRLIDAVDESYIIRKASYGMLQDEVSKYSLRLMKINLKNAFKPKIYNIKNAIDPSLVGVANSMGMLTLNSFKKLPPVPGNRQAADAGSILSGNAGVDNNGFSSLSGGAGGAGGAGTGFVGGAGAGGGSSIGAVGAGGFNTIVEQVKVPFPVLVDKYNIMAKSENTTLDNKKFYGFGRLQVLLYPFDNILKFSIASGSEEAPEYFNMTGFNEINFVIKNDTTQVSFPLFIESGDIDLVNGQVTFKINEGKFKEIKKIYNDGVNLFYITGKNQSSTSVVYTGLYQIYDDINNISDLNKVAATEQAIAEATKAAEPTIIQDPSIPKEIATITRKLASDSTTTNKSKFDSTKGTPVQKPNQLKDLQNKIGKKFRGK